MTGGEYEAVETANTKFDFRNVFLNAVELQNFIWKRIYILRILQLYWKNKE